MSLAEVIAATLAAFLASVSVVAYLMDAGGIGLAPPVVLALSLTISGTVAFTSFAKAPAVKKPDTTST